MMLTTLGGSIVKLHLCLSDGNVVFSQAIEAGAKKSTPVENRLRRLSA
ncbi:hypothetical protein [Methylomonas sp. MgM2]